MFDGILAFDKSVRRYDKDGRLHVELTPITKANICPYYGREIPGAEELGLDPNRIYQLFRDPTELEKAAHTFNNIQLLSRHPNSTEGNLSAANPLKHLVVGSTGTDAVFEAPFLKNSLVVAIDSAIRDVEDEKTHELSSSYHYKPVMEPGNYEGAHYDGRMTEIVGNHVALVPDGRAGNDVLVEDAMPPGMRNPQENNMPASRKALLVRGALSAYLMPKLAKDAKIDLKPVLLGTTAANWSAAKPEIVARLTRAASGKLAKDAKLDDMHAFLDSLDREGDGEPDTMDAEPDARREACDKALGHKATDEEFSEWAKKEAKEPEAKDEEAETEEERKERMERRKEAKDKAARDKAARDAESPEMKEKREKEERERKEAEDRKARDAEPKPVTKAAMDAAIADAVAESNRKHAALRDAERAVEPLIGKLAMPQESAEAVYRLAMDSVGVKHAGVHPSAYPAMIEMAKERARDKQRAAPLAHDAAPAKGFAAAHPEVARIKVI